MIGRHPAFFVMVLPSVFGNLPFVRVSGDSMLEVELEVWKTPWP